MKKKYSSLPFNIIFFLCIILIIIFSSYIIIHASNEERLYPRNYNNLYQKKNSNVFLDIECHSGSPLILEFLLNDKDKIVRSVDFDFDNDGTIDLNINNIQTGVIFRGTPFRKSGNYKISAFLNTSYGIFMRLFCLSFIDFEWGKNNFSFANDGEFENGIDFVSKTIISWAKERFGELNQDQELVLLYTMYNLYKGSIGRCYGFSGGEAYFLKHREKIPDSYSYTYLIFEDDPRIIRFMDSMQNDIVFSNFISGKIDLKKRQNNEDLLKELAITKDETYSGNPIILGYISKKMHHSMIVYGYVENKFRKKTTLITANNWERKQDNNYFSEDAENVIVQFSRNTHSITWYDLTKRRYRYPDKIFAIKIDDHYDLSKDDFFALVQKTQNDIISNKNTILMIEKTEVAYIEDENGKKSGYIKPNIINEIEGASIKKIDYNFIIEFPTKNNYKLVLKKPRYNKDKKRYKDVNIFAIMPDAQDLKIFIFNNIYIKNDTERIFKISKDTITKQ